ncbi:MAG: lysophospholipid acyltransferase family protein [Deltaproteobacteria bacterium]|nr:lysophospholipid acyltransferase family protein [Deltaproteobacteria bacterium]
MTAPAKNSGPTIKLYLEYLTYLVVRLVEEALCLIPSLEKALAVGRAVGRLGFVLVPDRRQAAIENLTIAFGAERAPAQIRLLARRNFEHLGMMGVEFFRLRRWTQDELAERLILSGQDNFNLAWSPGRRGILYLMAHVGSFEVLAATSRFQGMSAYLVVTGMGNRFVDRRMLHGRGGNDSGLRIIPHRGVVHKVIEALKAGDVVGALGDQRGDDTRPVWVDFFGAKALANGVFARFAMEGDAYCFPVRALRGENGKYRVIYEKELPIQVTDDKDHDIAVNSQRFHEVFEQWLRETPEQGFWMHRKFKRKPKKR